MININRTHRSLSLGHAIELYWLQVSPRVLSWECKSGFAINSCVELERRDEERHADRALETKSVVEVKEGILERASITARKTRAAPETLFLLNSITRMSAVTPLSYAPLSSRLQPSRALGAEVRLPYDLLRCP